MSRREGGTSSKLKRKGSGKEQITKVFWLLTYIKRRTVLEG
jgi:hypothetical protein